MVGTAIHSAARRDTVTDADNRGEEMVEETVLESAFRTTPSEAPSSDVFCGWRDGRAHALYRLEPNPTWPDRSVVPGASFGSCIVRQFAPLSPGLGEIVDCWSVDDLSEPVEARSVTWAVPRLLDRVPVDDAVEMRAHR